jgi:hypothetical protein
VRLFVYTMIDLNKPKVAYKLFKLRKSQTLGPLFVNTKQVIPFDQWLRAEKFRPTRLAYRPGWHVCERPVAPHLAGRGRVWCEVEVDDFLRVPRPECQGGAWLLAKWIKVNSIIGVHLYGVDKLHQEHDEKTLHTVSPNN